MSLSWYNACTIQIVLAQSNMTLLRPLPDLNTLTGASYNVAASVSFGHQCVERYGDISRFQLTDACCRVVVQRYAGGVAYFSSAPPTPTRQASTMISLTGVAAGMKATPFHSAQNSANHLRSAFILEFMFMLPDVIAVSASNNN